MRTLCFKHIWNTDSALFGENVSPVPKCSLTGYKKGSMKVIEGCDLNSEVFYTFKKRRESLSFLACCKGKLNSPGKWLWDVQKAFLCRLNCKKGLPSHPLAWQVRSLLNPCIISHWITQAAHIWALAAGSEIQKCFWGGKNLLCIRLCSVKTQDGFERKSD